MLVLIAGTNGKGSTASTLASILSSSSLCTGLYTSPHLELVNERIRIDGQQIADDDFGRLFHQIQVAAAQLLASGVLPQPPSYFEILTVLAFLYFAETKVHIAVLEVGMGGRFDATNVVDPLISVITDISLDHTEWLGSTIAAIAREKAGILRSNGTLITLPQLPEANLALGQVAMDLAVRSINATSFMPPVATAAGKTYAVEALGQSVVVASPLIGSHQQRNVALAIASAVELATTHQFPITPASIAQGIAQTCWPGRFERLTVRGQQWILDVAHNPAGAWALRAGLTAAFVASGHQADNQPRVLVFACLRDKPIREMAQILFPLFDQVLFAPIHSPRAAAGEDFLAAARVTGTRASAASSVSQALQIAAAQSEGAPIVVSGSVYLVGEARSILLAQEGQIL